MQRTKPVEVVAGIIWKTQPKSFLVQERPPNAKLFPGYWEFPGGKVEPNESLENAMQRELEEELDIRITDFEFWKTDFHYYSTNDLSVNLNYFIIKQFSGEPKGLEGQKITWIQKDTNTQELNFLEADLEILKELKSQLA